MNFLNTYCIIVKPKTRSIFCGLSTMFSAEFVISKSFRSHTKIFRRQHSSKQTEAPWRRCSARAYLAFYFGKHSIIDFWESPKYTSALRNSCSENIRIISSKLPTTECFFCRFFSFPQWEFKVNSTENIFLKDETC